METPFLQPYLERKASDPTSAFRDLLWKYFIHRRQFSAAAKQLAQRAEADEYVRHAERHPERRAGVDRGRQGDAWMAPAP